jgi:hypothetical protein
VHSEDIPTAIEDPAGTGQTLVRSPENRQSPAALKPLSARQNRALQALLTAKSVADAARKASVGERSLHRWVREHPEFRRRLQEAHRDAVSQAAHSLQQASAYAAYNLAQMLDDPDRATMGRIAAVRTVLEFAFRFAEEPDAG